LKSAAGPGAPGFQGRFNAHLVEEDAYARELSKYIHLNPVRPKDKRKPVPPKLKRELTRYRWSSHRVYAGLGKEPVAATVSFRRSVLLFAIRPSSLQSTMPC